MPNYQNYLIEDLYALLFLKPEELSNRRIRNILEELISRFKINKSTDFIFEIKVSNEDKVAQFDSRRNTLEIYVPPFDKENYSRSSRFFTIYRVVEIIACLYHELEHVEQNIFYLDNIYHFVKDNKDYSKDEIKTMLNLISYLGESNYNDIAGSENSLSIVKYYFQHIEVKAREKELSVMKDILDKMYEISKDDIYLELFKEFRKDARANEDYVLKMAKEYYGTTLLSEVKAKVQKENIEKGLLIKKNIYNDLIKDETSKKNNPTR